VERDTERNDHVIVKRERGEREEGEDRREEEEAEGTLRGIERVESSRVAGGGGGGVVKSAIERPRL
jgi:hypothetical protein